MNEVPTLRPLGIACAIIGIIQSIGWIAMSIIGILYHECVIDYRGTPTNNEFSFYLYTRYLQNPQCGLYSSNYTEPELLKPNVIFVILCIYIGFSFIWLCLSSFLLHVFLNNKKSSINCAVFMWFALALETCGMDLALTILFGLDFQDIKPDSYQINNETAAFAMMTLAARGYILWVVNFVLAICLLIYTLKVPKTTTTRSQLVNEDDNTSFSSKFTGKSTLKNQQQWHPPIDAFSYFNNGSNSDASIPQSSFQNSYLGWTLRRPSNNMPTRTTKTLNESRNNNINRDHEPYDIPTPDYSPVLPRANYPLKSTLKSQSRYQ